MIAFQLSALTDLIKQVENTDFNFISPQFVSVLRQVGQTMDLQEEMGFSTQWILWDSTDNYIPTYTDVMAFDAGKFSFKKPGQYRIEMNHYGLLFNHSGDNCYDVQIFYDVTVVDSVARPVFSPRSGAVKRHTLVSLSTVTPDARIYYTTDGSLPDSAALLYTEPISIDEAVTIKAIAIKDTMASRVATASYKIIKDTTDNEYNVFTTCVSIYTKDNVIYVPETIGSVEVFASNGQCVYRGSATAIPVKRSGLYVVVAKGGRWKVAVR